MRELMLEELFAGEVLEVGALDPALAHLLIRQAMDVLQEQQADHEARRHGGSTLLGKQRRNLAIDPRPINLPGQLHQLVPAIDDLVEP